MTNARQATLISSTKAEFLQNPPASYILKAEYGQMDILLKISAKNQWKNQTGCTEYCFQIYICAGQTHLLSFVSQAEERSEILYLSSK